MRIRAEVARRSLVDNKAAEEIPSIKLEDTGKELTDDDFDVLVLFLYR